MKKVGPRVGLISVVSALIFFVLYTILLRFQGMGFQEMFAAATKIGIIFGLIGLFWTFYDRVGWRVDGLRLWGFLSDVPDLRGRWEGTVQRNTEDKPHPIVVEISQTFTSISYKSFSRNSEGESLVANIYANETGESYKVFATWSTKTRQIADRTKVDVFSGHSTWTVSIAGDKKIIGDRYFTDREPQTKGVLELEWKSKSILNRFESNSQQEST